MVSGKGGASAPIQYPPNASGPAPSNVPEDSSVDASRGSPRRRPPTPGHRASDTPTSTTSDTNDTSQVVSSPKVTGRTSSGSVIEGRPQATKSAPQPDTASPAIKSPSIGVKKMGALHRLSIDQSKPNATMNHLFTKENVCVHPDTTTHIPGRLTLTEQGPHDPILLTWTPYSVITATSAFPRQTATPPSTASGQVAKAAAEFNKLNPANSRPGTEIPPAVAPTSTPDAKKTPALYAIRLPLAQIHALKRMKPPMVDPYVIIILKEGVTFPPLCFHAGGVGSFFSAARKHVSLTASPTDSNLVLVNGEKDDLLDKPAPPKSMLQTATSALNVKEASWSLLGQFSKVTKFARDTTAYLMNKDGEGVPPPSTPPPLGPSTTTPTTTTTSTSTANGVGAKGGNATVNSNNTPETTSTTTDPHVLAQSMARDLIHWQVTPRTPAVTRGGAEASSSEFKGLSEKEWVSLLDKEGRVTNVTRVKEAVFYGGCEESIRSQVWPFLTGQYSFDSTLAERQDLAAKHREEYAIIKQQWTTILPAQESRNSKWRERRHRIEKDVVRTDRTFEFFAGQDNGNLTTLFDILVTYAYYNFDLGYCQGMSDILAPILYIMKDEVEAFWCFAAIMERMEPNFQKDQHGMHGQLLALRNLLQVLHPSLYTYFDVHNCLNLFFCFRWVLLQFKREFSFEDVIRMYEVFWSQHLTTQFHLFMAIGLLDKYKKHIVNNRMRFDDILKYINECSGAIDLNDALYRGEQCYLTYRDMCKPEGAAVGERSANTPLAGDDTATARDSGSKGQAEEMPTAATTPQIK